MMFLTVAVVLGTLLSSTHAALSSAPRRRTQSMSLGQTVLAIAKNYTLSDRNVTTTKSGSFSLELEASAIKPLAAKVDLLCTKQGSVSSKSQSGNDTVATSYSLGCSLTKEKYGVYEAAVIALLKTAQGNSTSYTYYMDTSTYGDSYYSIGDPQIYLAQQKALERLMVKADTIEDVMLVLTSWQGVVTSFVSNNPTSSSTISVNLNQKYQDGGYPPFPPFPPYPLLPRNVDAP
jgi:hypothetical protein